LEELRKGDYKRITLPFKTNKRKGAIVSLERLKEKRKKK